MRRGEHAADDGSFARSGMVHMGRGIVLLAVAFALGVGLLHSADRSGVTIATGSPATEPKTTTTTPQAAPPTTAAAALRDPRTIKVLSANGTSTNGIGDKVRRKLEAANYNALAAVTATSKTQTSAIFFSPGFDADARAVAAVLGIPATAVQAMPAKPPVPQLGDANILVIAGTDILPSLSPTSGTTTTVRRTTATTARSSTSSTTAHTSSTTTASSTTSTPRKP